VIDIALDDEQTTERAPSSFTQMNRKAVACDRNKDCLTCKRVRDDIEAITSKPADVPLESAPSASNEHSCKLTLLASATLNAAPPETIAPTVLFLIASNILQLEKLEFFIDTAEALETATAPPRTAKFPTFAPCAVQLMKLHDETSTEDD
jgi:hypothetical protein